MKIIAIIPARFGSTRLTGKPLQLIAQKPMVQWVYERTLECPKLSRVIVATDDQRIVDCVQQFGGEAVLTEGDFATGTDRIAHVAAKLQLSQNTILLNVQGDQPLVHPQSLSQLIDAFVDSDNKNHEMATLVFAMPYDEDGVQNPTLVKTVIDNKGYALYFSRHAIPCGRDSTPPELLIHLGIYIYTHQFVRQFSQLPQGYLENLEKLEQLRLLEHGYKVKVISSRYGSPEVDSLKDIKKIEALIENE